LLKSAAFRAVTLRTIVHRPILEKQLQNARKTGLAFTFGESTSSLAGISAAVVDETKEYAGAVTLLSPYQRDYNVIDRRLLSHVKQTAARIARALGAEPYPYPQI
jgi:DNA-binding IclR family transcriptional regulator